MSNFRIYCTMKKIMYLLLFTLLILLILSNSYDIIENIRFSFSVCVNNVFPSLIPFMILSNIIINYDFIEELSDIFKNIMVKIFKVSKNCSFALIMSMLSGTPSNAKYINDLYTNNLITLSDVKKCLNFCHFTNPIFILGTIGLSFLGNKKIGLVILISHFLSSIILGLLNKKEDINDLSFIHKKINKNFINIFKDSIKTTIDTLLLILGIITSCIIITCIIDNIISIDMNYKFVYGLLEITQGLKYLSLSNLSIEIKAIISSFIISFGGLCIHAQVFTIIDNKKIRYIPYFLSRLKQAIISSILTYLIINIGILN